MLAREQIRATRVVPLVPLLQQRGLPARKRDAGNFELATHPGLLLKDSYWREKTEDWSGQQANSGWLRLTGSS